MEGRREFKRGGREGVREWEGGKERKFSSMDGLDSFLQMRADLLFYMGV